MKSVTGLTNEHRLDNAPHAKRPNKLANPIVATKRAPEKNKFSMSNFTAA